jgi:serine/threonine-protein kinase
MWRGGNSQVGFEVSYDNVRRILYLRMWGLWDEPLAVQYRDAVMVAMRPLTPARPSYVLADLARYPTQKPAVQKYHAELMGKSASYGITRSANLVSATLTSMQIRRLSQESGIAEFSFFQDEEKAIEWLLSGADADEDAVAKLTVRKRE